jgi:hypothetical protein
MVQDYFIPACLGDREGWKERIVRKKSPGNHEVMEKEDGSMAVTTLQQHLERDSYNVCMPA